MIIKGQSRGRSWQLAGHLLRKDQNESIRLYETRGTVAGDVESALAEMEALGAGVRCKRPLYHASISPEAHTPLTETQIGIAVSTLAAALGLEHQPRVVVVHRKDAREHVHVVWSRIDTERNRAIPDSWNYRCHEEAARALEGLFGHRPVSRSSSRKLTARKDRAPQDYEFRQEERTGRPASQITAEISALWRSSTDGKSFHGKLEEAGYRLARGDRRVLVAIDRNGEVHSLARRVDGANTRDIRARFQDIDLQSLPAVSEVRSRPGNACSATPVRQSFGAVAGEVTRRAEMPWGRRASLDKSLSLARKAFLEINSFPAPTRVSKPMRVPVRINVEPTRHILRGLRGIIIAHYAAKIANARRNTAPDELAATLAALLAEREAALAALAQRQQGDARALRKPRSRRNKAVTRPPGNQRQRIKRWRSRD